LLPPSQHGREKRFVMALHVLIEGEERNPTKAKSKTRLPIVEV
jgi:hypothetical protein